MKLDKYFYAAKKYRWFARDAFIRNFRVLFNILKYSIYPKGEIARNKPISAQIESTSLCNLNCEMCVRTTLGIPVNNMSFENFKKILDKLDLLVKIHLQGLGEPFINKEIFKMIDYATSKGIIVNLNTNATLINSELANQICRSNIGELAISIDSVNKKLYEEIRRGANFEKVLENIRLLSRTRNIINRGLTLSLAVTIMQKNLEELPDFVNLAKDLGIEKVIYQTLQTKEDFVRVYRKETKKQLISKVDRLNSLIREARRRAKKFGIEVLFDEEEKGCVWPWRNIYITWEGYVTPCCKIVDYRKPYFGNLLKQDFWEIWNGKQYRAFRKMMLKGVAPIPCKGCSVFIEKNV